MKRSVLITFMAVSMISVVWACAPEIGSEAWCEDLQEKPKADWTAREAKDYAKHCLLK